MNPEAQYPMSLYTQSIPSIEQRLRQLGWRSADEVPGLWRTWVPPVDLIAPEILVPQDPQKADYDSLLRKAEDALRAATPERAWISTGATTASAPAEWEKESDTRPGTIRWDLGMQLHDSVSRQLAASARATVSRQAVLGQSNQYVGRYLLERTLLAPSGVGSYIVTALLPFNEPIYTQDVPTQKGKRPVERQHIETAEILRTLDSALKRVHESLNAGSPGDQVEALATGVEEGVSAELLTAVSSFVEDGEGAVKVPTYPWSGSERVNEYSFEPPQMESLQRAAARLREEEPAAEAWLAGVITALKHDPKEPDRVATVATTSRGPVRLVRAYLSEDDYRAAVSAHRDELIVRLSGRLWRPGKSWRMDVGHLEILGSADDWDE